MANEWSLFRPISLCNTVHKIISKMLNEILIPLLPSLIFVNQSGFLQRRSIADNILLTQELTHDIDRKCRGSNLILKLDLLKAYDRLNWDFVEKVLLAFGFSPVWIDLIMRTIRG